MQNGNLLAKSLGNCSVLPPRKTWGRVTFSAFIDEAYSENFLSRETLCLRSATYNIEVLSGMRGIRGKCPSRGLLLRQSTCIPDSSARQTQTLHMVSSAIWHLHQVNTIINASRTCPTVVFIFFCRLLSQYFLLANDYFGILKKGCRNQSKSLQPM